MKKPLGLALLAGLALGGCTSKDRDMPLASTLKGAVKTMMAGKADIPGQRRAVESLSREQLVGVATDPLILVDIEASQQYATLNQISQNGQSAVFMSGDQKTLTFSRGLLTATRGMGADLMSLDVSQTRAAILAETGGKTILARTHRRLNGEHAIKITGYTCQLSDLGIVRITSIHKDMTLRRYQETCLSGDDTPVRYINDYWVAPKSKVIWKSRQWVSQTIGYIGIEVLIPERS